MRSIHRFMAVLLIALAGCTWATGITFTFGNIRVTGSAPKVIEFDVLAQASENGTFLGDTQVYINYNTLGFGEYIAANSKVTVIKRVLLQGEVPIVGPKYELINTLDNTIDRFSVAANYRFDGSLEGANPLTTAPQSLFSVAIEILDPLQTAGLSFAEDLMVGQQYQYDNTAKYDPVNADDQDDSSLPVQLNSFSATRQAHGIELVWTTESEIDNLGFNLFRSDSDSGPWIQINGALIPGAGRSSEPIDYIFFDNRVETIASIATSWKISAPPAAPGARACGGRCRNLYSRRLPPRTELPQSLQSADHAFLWPAGAEPGDPRHLQLCAANGSRV
jgi:hypothetical protein